MLWRLTSYPRCTHHVFLSHCREDHDALVRPVHERLTASSVRPWLDVSDYTYSRESRAALRDALVRSRHVVFFVTDAMLTTARGWCVLELGYTEILQSNFQMQGGPLVNVFLPLFFVSQGDTRLQRSVWQAARDRGRFYDQAADGDVIDWSVRAVTDFLRQEQQLSKEWTAAVRVDESLQSFLSATPGLRDRVTKFTPSRLPRA